MGLFQVSCLVCKKVFWWFSGNSGDQRCDECKEKEMKSLRDQICEAAADIPPTPYTKELPRMEGFTDGQECENARLTPLLEMLADVAEAADWASTDNDLIHEDFSGNLTDLTEALARLKEGLK